jgi:hypothetical protein
VCGGVCARARACVCVCVCVCVHVSFVNVRHRCAFMSEATAAHRLPQSTSAGAVLTTRILDAGCGLHECKGIKQKVAQWVGWGVGTLRVWQDQRFHPQRDLMTQWPPRARTQTQQAAALARNRWLWRQQHSHELGSLDSHTPAKDLNPRLHC